MVSKSIALKRIALVIAFVMLMMTGLGSLNASYATLYKNPTATQTDSVASSNSYKDEYYKVTTNEKNTIKVEGKTKIKTTRFCIKLTPHGSTTAKITVFVTPDKNGEFAVTINTKKGNKKTPVATKGTVAGADDSWDTRPGYRAVETIGPGTYHLTIARATTAKDAKINPGSNWWNGQLGGKDGKTYAYKEVVLTVAKGKNNDPKVVKYNTAINNNKNTTNLYEKKSYHDSSYKGSYVRYTDKYMKDMSFVFKNPKTGKQENMTAAKVKYVKGVADSVTAGAKSDYEKLLKIYEYVGSNFYYDVLANEQYKNQFANPYNNLYNLRNKVTAPNSKGGKVATTCQGYGAMVIALARAEGIPARLAYGHHISQPIAVWEGYKGKISERDHWWAEAWVNGRWVFIDANSATSSKWTRSSFSAAGTWTKGEGINYAHFDPTAAQLSGSYAYTGIYPGATDGKFINRKDEVAQLKAFLNTKSGGKSNGKKLNSKYSATNFATWGTTAADDFLTDGYGRVTHILWGNKNLTGKMNLAGFKELKYLTVYNNKITALTLTDCSSLEKISATYTKMTTFDSTASKNTTLISAKGNKLTSAKFKNGSSTVTIKRNVAGGTFAFDYDKSKSKKLTIYVNDPAKGYKYLGIYNSSGKKVSSGTQYSFNPSGTYTVKFAKK